MLKMRRTHSKYIGKTEKNVYVVTGDEIGSCKYYSESKRKLVLINSEHQVIAKRPAVLINDYKPFRKFDYILISLTTKFLSCKLLFQEQRNLLIFRTEKLKKLDILAP